MADIKERVARDSRLNKFVNHQVDYFDSGSGWQDFRNLVQHPVKGVLEYADDAFQALYALTEGNPFFTKLICKNLYALKCEARDAYVTREDIDEALRHTLNDLKASQVTLDSNNMGHFWTDGIAYQVQTNRTRRDEVETQRRRFLLAFADVKRQKKRVRREDLLASEYLDSETVSNKMIRSFEERGILVHEDESYRLRPRLLERWLVESGMRQLSVGYHDEQAVQALVERRERDYVKDTEIREVTRNWGLYQGRNIEVADVRLWLDQFEDTQQQRLIFKLLEHIQFFDVLQMREAVQVINGRIRTHREIKKGEQRRRDIVVSAFGGIGKSGPSVARLYRQENNIFHDLLVDVDELKSTLEKNSRVRAVVLVDDIIGTGQQSLAAFHKIKRDLGDFLKEREVRIYITAICGLKSGLNHISKEVKKASFQVEVYVVHEFGESDQCFSESSEIFDSDLEREKAMQIVQTYGAKLVRDMAMGFENSQLLVTFSDQCPNNTLPIFWSDAIGWTPLFKRK